MRAPVRRRRCARSASRTRRRSGSSGCSRSTPRLAEGIERLLQALVTQGVSAVDALAIYRAVASYARGYALAETTGFTVDATSAAARERLRALPAADFPVLGGQAGELAALDADRGFAHGLDALLTGLERAAR